jgi:hypothetical protein
MASQQRCWRWPSRRTVTKNAPSSLAPQLKIHSKERLSCGVWSCWSLQELWTRLALRELVASRALVERPQVPGQAQHTPTKRMSAVKTELGIRPSTSKALGDCGWTSILVI